MTEEFVEEAKTEVEKKKDLPAIQRIRFEGFDEGISAHPAPWPLLGGGTDQREGPNPRG